MRTFSAFIALLCLASAEVANAFSAPQARYTARSVKAPTTNFHVVSHQKHTSLRQASVPMDGSCDPFDPESDEFCTTPEDEIDGSMKRTLKLTGLFALWYVLNIGYNIGNKRVLNALPIPWSVATVELFFGFPYVAMLWLTGLRKAPKLSVDNVKTLSSQAFFLAATHVLGVISFGAGAISFTHIVKATEPVWSALLLGVCFKEILPLPVYLSLVPIIAGVGLASLKELSFTWLSFAAGTLSAVTSATKAILSKKVLDGKPMGENLTPANMVRFIGDMFT
jgi:solute carrier family 35 protein E1